MARFILFLCKHSTTSVAAMFGKYSRRNIRHRRDAAADLCKTVEVPPTEEELAAVVMPAAAHPRFLNLKPSPPDERDLKMHHFSTSFTAIPPALDLTPFLPPALDQGEIGSCAANASGLALRYLYKKQLQQDWMPSRLAIYYVTRVYMTGDAPGDDSGCVLRDVCKAVAKYTLPPEMYWKYDTSKFSLPPPYLQANEQAPTPLIEYRAVSLTEYALKAALALRFPVVIGIALYDSMTAAVAASGVVPMPNLATDQPIGGHAVLLVGYTASGTWIVRNSWGTWGKTGNFTLPIAYLTDPNLCFDAFVFSKAIEE
jgi:hypothetical protein